MRPAGHPRDEDRHELDVGLDLLPTQWVGNRHCGGVLDLGIARRTSSTSRAEMFSLAPADHVLDAADDVEVPVLVLRETGRRSGTSRQNEAALASGFR
jgi:hypothetical protein